MKNISKFLISIYFLEKSIAVNSSLHQFIELHLLRIAIKLIKVQ